jgi:hypothetical protein
LHDFFLFVASLFFSHSSHAGSAPVSCFDFWIAEQALLSACVNWGSPPEACANLILRRCAARHEPGYVVACPGIFFLTARGHYWPHSLRKDQSLAKLSQFLHQRSHVVSCHDQTRFSTFSRQTL